MVAAFLDLALRTLVGMTEVLVWGVLGLALALVIVALAIAFAALVSRLVRGF